MISIVAGATFREALRSRSFLGLLGIYTVAVLLSRIVGWISGTDGHVVTMDMVFSLQSVIGVLVAVATGTALMHSEIMQRTLYTVITRPLGRLHFVLGKFLGLAAALLVGQLAMGAVGLIYLVATGAPFSTGLCWAVLLTILEVVIMAGISLMWTSLSSPLLAAVLSLVTYALGHAVHELPALMFNLSGWQMNIAVFFASLVPDLGAFAYRNEAVYDLPISSDYLIAVPYGIAWLALSVAITTITFNRRQL